MILAPHLCVCLEWLDDLNDINQSIQMLDEETLEDHPKKPKSFFVSTMSEFLS
jgi:hypothetical protein